ncbi:MAG TPA: glycosyltransferase family 4 protein [Chthonomonadaceae bacterium]|nr:glycosyltransferase family 4 protein [Chthonomonadaceae bacterium]
MKVLLLSNLYPSRREPTFGMFHYNLFGELSRHCETRLIAPVPWWWRIKQPMDWIRPPHETHTGIDAVFPCYWSIPSMHSIHAKCMYWTLLRRVKRLRRTFPFDIILAAWAYPDAVAGAYLAQKFDCPLVSKVLGSDINENTRDEKMRKQVLWALNRSHTIMAVSGALEEKLVEMGIPRERIVMHHNGVNGTQFTVKDRNEARARVGLPLDRTIICYVGNLKPEKGVDVLVEAMAELHKLGREDADLVVIGGGAQEPSLRARASALGLENRIRFIGKKPHTEIPDWISASDIFCLPSRREGCPNVILEGLASGRPVVATAVGGVPELIHGDNGILVPSENPAALAAGLKEGLERAWDPVQLRSSVESLSWEEISLTLYNLLARAISDHTGHPQLAMS